MFGVGCFDTHNNPIDHYTQWDVDQKLKIVVYDADDNLLKNAPYVHFANVKSTEALVVRSTVEGTDTIIVEIPNSLLQEPWPLLVYVYLNDNLDAHSQKTIIKIEIPVHKRVKPSDYEYVENIERITAEVIKQEVTEEFVDDITSGELPLPYVYIIDATNGGKQRIGVSNDKATLDVNTSGSAQTYSILDTRDKEEISHNIDTMSQELSQEITTTSQTLSQEIDSDIFAHNSSTSAHSDIRGLISAVDSRVDDANSDIDDANSRIDTLNATVSALDTNKVNKSDIVNNLTTDDSTKPLSAAMGMELKNSLDSGGSANELISAHNTNNEAHTDIRDLVTAAHQRADDAYTAAMAGGGSAAEGIEAHNTSKTAHMDIREMIESISATEYTAGNGIEISSSDVISAKVDNNSIVVDGSGNISAKCNESKGLTYGTSGIETRVDGTTISYDSSGNMTVIGGGSGGSFAPLTDEEIEQIWNET